MSGLRGGYQHLIAEAPYAQQQVHVLWPYMTLQYFYLVSSTDLSDKIPQANCHISSQSRLAVLRDEYKVIV